MDNDTSAVIEQAVALKASAKSARQDEDWESALEDIEEAIEILKHSNGSNLARERQLLNAELADTYGTLGGIHRRLALTLDSEARQRHLVESFEAYNEGYELEADLPLREASTYNQVNRILAKVLVAPDDVAGPEIAVELRAAEEAVQIQVAGSRQKDPWAYCDLCTLQALSNDEAAWTTLAQLRRLRPPAFVMQSWSTTLNPLASAVGPRSPELVRLAEAVERISGSPG
jgi:hypothetical protein